MNENIIELELPQKLQESEIVTDFTFDITTTSFVLDLNYKNNEIRIVVSYNKNWTRLKQTFQKEFQENEIEDKDRRLLLKALNSNFHTITLALEKLEQQHLSQLEERGENYNNRISPPSIADLIVASAVEKCTLFQNEFGIPHALFEMDNHYEVLSIDGKKFERYLSKLFYDEFGSVPSADAINNAVRTLGAKAIFEGEMIPLHLRVAWSNPQMKDSIY